jgi:endonuclease-3
MTRAVRIAARSAPRARRLPAGARQRATEVVERLKREYPEAHTELEHGDPFQLLVATILSAQTTDVRVNLTTPALFARFPDAAAMAAADPVELEGMIKPTGFFRTKARAIREMSQDLMQRFGGEVPATMEQLVTLRGVGRKTANVVLNVAYGEPTIAVDTHIFRVCNRTGLAPGRTPLEVEQGLERVVPAQWKKGCHHWLILHGRYICVARRPNCPACVVRDLCAYPAKTTADAAAKPAPKKVARPVSTAAAKARRRGAAR